MDIYHFKYRQYNIPFIEKVFTGKNQQESKNFVISAFVQRNRRFSTF